MLWFALISVPYLVLILTAWIQLVRKSAVKHPLNIDKEKLPSITVIVPARNEEVNLPNLIRDLLNLNYPEEKMEVIIVDDNSDDGTVNIIKDVDRITSLTSPGDGKKQAIAFALEQSSGELVLTTDADCRIPAEWLNHYASEYISEKADLIIGQVEPTQSRSITAIFSNLEFFSLQALSGGMALAGRAIMCNGANLGFRRSMAPVYLASVRGDIVSGDDMFLLHSIKKKGGKICWLDNKGSMVKTVLPGSVKALLNQRRRWASKARFYKDRDTLLAGMVTSVANLSIVLFLALSIFNTDYLLPALALYIIKTVPEIMLLANYLRRQKSLNLLVWFIPASLIYPIYVLITLIISLFPKKTW